MHISGKNENAFVIDIGYNSFSSVLLYNPAEKILIFPEENVLSEILKKNAYQLKKILRNKREDTFYIGFKLKFVLRNNDDAVQFNEPSNLIVIDDLNKNRKVYTHNWYECNFTEVFTDGAFSDKMNMSAYVVLFKNHNGLYNMHYGTNKIQSSSMAELTAVIKALKIFRNRDKIRIITDSRYVIKGLTEWIGYWRLNNWYTAQGEKVRNIDSWKEYESLTKGKYIEYQWVKAHSLHYENNICDHYASELLKRCL